MGRGVAVQYVYGEEVLHYISVHTVVYETPVRSTEKVLSKSAHACVSIGRWWQYFDLFKDNWSL